MILKESSGRDQGKVRVESPPYHADRNVHKSIVRQRIALLGPGSILQMTKDRSIWKTFFVSAHRGLLDKSNTSLSPKVRPSHGGREGLQLEIVSIIHQVFRTEQDLQPIPPNDTAQKLDSTVWTCRTYIDMG